MRYFLFTSGSDSTIQVGAQQTVDGGFLNLSKWCASATPSFGKSMRRVLDLIHNDGDDEWNATRARLREGLADTSAFTEDASAITLKAPIYDPEKIICVGMNYSDHCSEQGMPEPDEPVLFNKFPSAILGHKDDVYKIAETTKFDWEVEMVIVVGKDGRRISKADAYKHVAGYTVAHDVSARDLQLEHSGGQWMLGKAFDHACPIGPAIVDTAEIPDPHKLALKTTVNGVVKQDSNTDQLIFKVHDVIEYCSKFFTLKAGDLILTGTPPGVGAFRSPPEWLVEGDEVTVEIEGIGAITNTIVADATVEAAAAASASSASA
jgi:2-keto-4-pentenoate hydratase/2-oxohepta-3-ene-1,7-dioic acid hydratase in catechol pathway